MEKRVQSEAFSSRDLGSSLETDGKTFNVDEKTLQEKIDDGLLQDYVDDGFLSPDASPKENFESAKSLDLIFQVLNARVEEVVIDTCSFSTESECIEMVVVPDSGPRKGESFSLREYETSDFQGKYPEAGQLIVLGYDESTDLYFFNGYPGEVE